jgi:transposase
VNQHHLRELTYLLEEQNQAWAGDMIELLTKASTHGQSQLR